MSALQPHRLGLLAPEDQPVTTDASGRTMDPVPKPQAPAGTGMPGPQNPMPPGMADPLAPAGYGEQPAPQVDDDALMAQPVTPEEADQMVGLESALAKALEDDEDPEDSGGLMAATDDELLKLFEAYFTAAAEFRKPWEDRWIQSWKDYNFIIEGDLARWNSKTFLPLVFQQTSSAIPAMVASVYDSGPVWGATAVKREHQSRAKPVAAVLDFFMRHKVPSQRRIRDALWWSSLFGTAFIEIGWKHVVGVSRQRKPVYTADPETLARGTFLGTRKVVKQGEVVESVPVLDVIELWDAYPAPHTRDDEYFPYFIRGKDFTIEDLEKAAKAGALGKDGPARVKKFLETRPEDTLARDTVFSAAISRSEAWRKVGMGEPRPNLTAVASATDVDRSKSMVHVWEMKTDQHVLTVSGDGTQVLGIIPNPWWFKKIAIVAHQFERIPGCIFGVGIGDVMRGIQKQTNFNYNKGNDAVQLALNAPIAVRQSGNALVSGSVAWQPGALIPCRDPKSDIVPLQIPDPMGSVFRLEEHLLGHGDRATGINDISHGLSPQGANTATEFAGLQSQVRLRLSQHVREIKATVGKIGSYLLRLVQQFVTKPMAIQIAGTSGLDWVEVTPEDLIQEYHLVASANATTSNPALLRSDVVALTPIVQSSSVVKQDVWMRHVLRTFEIPNVDEMIQPPPPPARDPMLEESLLEMGIPVPPSPFEDVAAHVLTHQQMLATTPPNSPAYNARRDHLEQTLSLQSEMLIAQQGAGQPGPAQPGTSPAGGGTEARREASNSQGARAADGPPGRSPGPAGAPSRPERK